MAEHDQNPSNGPGSNDAEQPGASSPSSPESPADETPPPTADQQNMAMLGHLLGVVGFVGPLVIWLLKKDESTYVETEAKESLNFHLVFMGAYLLLIPVSVITCGIGTFLYFPVYLVELIFAIIAAVEVNKKQTYRYPFNYRMVQ